MMTIKEANNQINKIDNQIEYYLSKKELELLKAQPQAVTIKDTIVGGGKRVDKFANYVISIKEIDDKLDELYAEKKIFDEYIDKELVRLKKYREVEQLIVYYKEQCPEELTWIQISFRVQLSEGHCRKIYRRWKKERKFENDHL